jgi:hypothetical protein
VGWICNLIGGFLGLRAEGAFGWLLFVASKWKSLASDCGAFCLLEKFEKGVLSLVETQHCFGCTPDVNVLVMRRTPNPLKRNWRLLIRRFQVTFQQIYKLMQRNKK